MSTTAATATTPMMAAISNHTVKDWPKKPEEVAAGFTTRVYDAEATSCFESVTVTVTLKFPELVGVHGSEGLLADVQPAGRPVYW
jgi:hypothetical protein